MGVLLIRRVFLESKFYCLFILLFRYQKDPLIPQANSTNIVAYETTTIFQISIYQYIGLVVAFSTAAPFRKSFLTNCKLNLYSTMAQKLILSLSLFLSSPPPPPPPSEDWFVLCLVVLFPANLYLTLAPPTWWKWFWAHTELKQNSDIYFKIGLVLLALNHCVLAYFLEVWHVHKQCMSS